MKHLYFSVFLLCFLCFNLFAQVAPKAFTFQGVAKVDNQVVTGGISVQISIRESSTSGSIVYRERQFPTTNMDGVFSINIGSPNAVVIQGNLGTIDWSAGNFFLQVELDPSGGANYEDMGTTQLLSVPFAMFADRAQTVMEESDGDPENELQTLSLVGSLLRLSDGGNVDLTPFESYWTPYYSSGSGAGIIYNALGEVTIGDVLPNNFGEGNLAVGGDTRYQRQGQAARMLVGVASGASSRIAMTANDVSTVLTYLGTSSGNDFGLLRTSNNNLDLAILSQADGGGGYFATDGSNGEKNISLSSLLGNNTHGFLSVAGTTGETEAGVYVNSDGNGVVFADIKNFRTPHPELPEHDIWYASLEGPEAGAYVRGTATLENGEAFIPYPEDFRFIVNPSTVTVILTPLSADSKGLAVITKKEDGFVVKELQQGTGNYQVDWEVKGVRQGYEDYEVVRHRNTATPSQNMKSEE